MRRSAAASLLAVIAASTVLISSPASATTVGDLYLTPAKGNDNSVITVVTSGPCPKDAKNVKNILVIIYGRGFPQGQNVVGNSPLAIYPRTATGGYRIPLQYTLADTAKLAKGISALSGTYRLEAVCRGPIRPVDAGRFVGTFTVAKKVTSAGLRTYTAPTAPSSVPVTPTTSPGSLAGNNPKGSPGAPTQAVPTPQGLTPTPVGGSAASGADTTAASSASIRWAVVVLFLIVAFAIWRWRVARRQPK